MFESESIQDLIQFKWDAFGRNWHLFGCIIHFAYITILFYYTNQIYIKGSGSDGEDELSE